MTLNFCFYNIALKKYKFNTSSEPLSWDSKENGTQYRVIGYVQGAGLLWISMQRKTTTSSDEMISNIASGWVALIFPS